MCTQSVRSNKERSLGDPQWINKLVTFSFFGPPWGQQVEANITIFFFLLTWIFKKEEATSCEWRAAYHSTLMIKTPALISPSTAWFLCVSISATSEVKRFFCKYFFFFFTFEGVNVAETCHFFFFFWHMKKWRPPLKLAPQRVTSIIFWVCVCFFVQLPHYCVSGTVKSSSDRSPFRHLPFITRVLSLHSFTNKQKVFNIEQKKKVSQEVKMTTRGHFLLSDKICKRSARTSFFLKKNITS